MVYECAYSWKSWSPHFRSADAKLFIRAVNGWIWRQMSSFVICFQDLGCCLINHRIMCVKILQFMRFMEVLRDSRNCLRFFWCVKAVDSQLYIIFIAIWSLKCKMCPLGMVLGMGCSWSFIEPYASFGKCSIWNLGCRKSGKFSVKLHIVSYMIYRW